LPAFKYIVDVNDCPYALLRFTATGIHSGGTLRGGVFYGRPHKYAAVMRSTIALNVSYYNAQRMLSQYVQNAYLTSDRFHIRYRGSAVR